jgi:hypothetical protein
MMMKKGTLTIPYPMWKKLEATAKKDTRSISWLARCIIGRALNIPEKEWHDGESEERGTSARRK